MEEITEEADYVNAPEGPVDKKATCPEDTKKESAPEGTVDTKASPPGLRFFLPIAVCWLILLAIMGLRIYLTYELSGNNAELYSRIQELETNWNELNISQAQWSINEYCKQGEERLTWEEARERCRALNAYLAAAHNEKEKIIILVYSPYSSATIGTWIGLRVENGKWKWEDGSDLTNSSWIDPPTEGHCALSIWSQTTWPSVSCDQKRR
ncbi:C-type lectin 1-like isoform X4 [Trematomus bernacchii]|uniref:C-type lectin 1-like isoform X4 n=1 Tax=Trematomus bernacchii TaxID=40690 RepID=UPI00146AE8A1|nr:C-type lectin 1-like isoform X4 [Trematomus bernacchii]